MPNTNPGDSYDRTNPTGSTPNPLESNVVQPNPESYGSGYVQGKAVERQRHETVQQTRDENNTANGFLIGILLTGLVLGGAALAYFATRNNDRAPEVQRTITAPSASPAPQVKERIIERDRLVPVPQPQQSAPTVIPAPNVTIEAPKPAPAAPAPQASPEAPSQQQTAPSSTEQKSAEPTTPAPEATASPNPAGSQ